MTFSITQYDRTVTVSTPSNDLSLWDALGHIEALLLAVGYAFRPGSLEVELTEEEHADLDAPEADPPPSAPAE